MEILHLKAVNRIHYSDVRHFTGFDRSYQFAYTGEQYSDATNAGFTADAIDGIVASYSVMDFSLQYQLNKRFGFYGSVNNFPMPNTLPEGQTAVRVRVLCLRRP